MSKSILCIYHISNIFIIKNQIMIVLEIFGILYDIFLTFS